MGSTREAAPWQPGQSGNPAGRKPGAEKVRQLLEPHREDLVKKAREMALAGDVTALRICMDRLAPPPRPESVAVEIPGLVEAKTLTDKAETIADAIGQGLLSPSTGGDLLQALAAACRVVEFDELQRRVAALEGRDLV